MSESLFGKLIGSSAPFAGLAISLSTYNEWMQAVSLTVGVAVALWSVLKKQK